MSRSEAENTGCSYVELGGLVRADLLQPWDLNLILT